MSGEEKPPAQPGSLAAPVVSSGTALLLLIALVVRFYSLGGPFLERPETIYDHVWPTRHPTVDAILAVRGARPFLPPGAEVTIIRPSILPEWEPTDFATAVGLLPEHRVVLPHSVARNGPDYVIAIGRPLSARALIFVHPRYRLIAGFRGGALYRKDEGA
ncbi:MAG TPA: hypothetical protein VMS98_14220 [Thermoanaerobaculia bacterium]|nr:hypothetical protein [Thermoanaerobaculia bacterium]